MVKRWISIDPDYYYSSDNVNFLIHVKALMAGTAMTAADDLITHKVFPSMDRIVHHRPDFGVGLSLSSNRTYKYESINNENLKGWYTSDGMLYLYNRDQDHYSEGYWATVNPYRLPGTTVDTRPRSAQSIPWGSDYVPVNRWARGASLDNKYGVSGLDLDAYGSDLAAKKSWFMFDDEIVALGAGITSQENVTVETIVENRRLNSSGGNVLTIDGTEKPSEMDWSETMPSVQWAHLAGSSPEAGIGYYFPKRADLNGARASANRCLERY
ncbi:polysaccharide lyase family 8 super-sandwich domain-containing protein [Paenibacillus sp. GD4]|uniref:polysaccharide lyase family 8 super-sandwich domain-containing protein n=1 Tax=Paenibacillus sp. GD4 TaxID=3068890 RepID=UPI002796B6CC|nr:polysaccharide lyase family 8 super-sandwich domain-containing protein [Paenibacillus sp. GD4]MDQ1911573.1 polysaccharide lyase family 8 super-sandwich domain-containing protein [Paenibacillus sp. GD4]